MTSVVAREVAEVDFERMCKSRRIEMDAKAMGEFDAAAFKSRKDGIIAEIMRGTIVVAENGDPTYQPPGGRPLTFRKATGATFISMDSREGPTRKAVAAATEMTQTNEGAISQLEVADFRVCMLLTNFFLAQ